jgi:hypothetical protein
MTKSPVSAIIGPIRAAFRRKSTFVAGAFLQASGDGYGARGSDLDGRAAETSRPNRRAAMGRSPTINVRHIDRPVVEGKTSADNDGHPDEGMSSAPGNPRHCRRRWASFPRGDIFRNSYALAKGGQNRSAIRMGRQKAGPHRLGTSRVQRASPFGDPFFSRQQRAARGARRQLIPSVMRGLKPNPFCQQRLRSTNFPFGYAEFLARQIRRPSPSSACAAALRVQAARAGLFCAAPRGTRWRWASGPRRKKEVLQNGFQPLQVLPQA